MLALILAQTPPMSGDYWLEFARIFGFNALLVLLLIYGSYRLGCMYIEKVAVPMNNRMIESVTHTDACLDQQTEVLRAIRDSLIQVNERISRLERERDLK